MGSPISQVAPSTQPQGKGFASPQPQSARQDGLDQNAINADPQGFQQWQQAQQTQQPQQFQPTQGKGGNVTFPGQGGQPRMGQPNMYPNTVGQWDNATIGTQQYQAPPTYQQPQQNGKLGGFRFRGKGV
jgi:hypothetical protein